MRRIKTYLTHGVRASVATALSSTDTWTELSQQKFWRTVMQNENLKVLVYKEHSNKSMETFNFKSLCNKETVYMASFFCYFLEFLGFHIFSFIFCEVTYFLVKILCLFLFQLVIFFSQAREWDLNNLIKIHNLFPHYIREKGFWQN